MDPTGIAVGASGAGGFGLLVFLLKHVFTKADGTQEKHGEMMQDIRITVSAIAQELKSLRDQVTGLQGELRGDARARAELEALVKVQEARLNALAGEVKDQGTLLHEAMVLRMAEARLQREGTCRTGSTD